jgi:iron complex transport system permease protein
MTPQRFLLPVVLLLVLVALGLFLPCVGPTLNPENYAPDVYREICRQIYWLRFYRTALALIAGGGLALAGLVFQAMFRNPLATPYTLGVASGAAFGAAVCLQTTIRLGLPGLIGAIPTVSLGAFLGASLAMGIVLVLSRHRDTSSEQMLLAGVAVNFFFSSLIVLVQYLSSPHDAFQILRWTMGGVQNAIPADLYRLTPIVLLLMLFLAVQSRTMNVFVTGNDRAKSLGINVEHFRTALFIVTSLVVGLIVSVTGPIGFVGLIVPHVARLLVGPDHRLLIISTGFLGAIFLALCDTMGRWLFYPAELPVGIITSLLGAPFFLWLLLKKK